MVVFLSFFYIAILMVYFFLGFLFSIKIKRSFLFALLSLFAFAFGLISFHIEPPDGWDLYRHFEELDRIRLGGLYYLFGEGSLYGKQIGSALLYYIVSLQPNNHLLPFLTIVIEYTIYAYIITDYVATNKKTIKTVFACIAIHFALTDITWTISSLRQPLACSLCALGMYVELVKKKKFGFLFYFLGASVHPGMLGFIAVRFIFMIRGVRKVLPFILVIWGAFARIVGTLLETSTSYWLRYIGSMLLVYISELAEIADLRFLVLKLVFAFIFLGLLLTKKEQNYFTNEEKDNKYKNVFVLMILFAIGSIVSPQIFMRYVMFLSFSFVPLADVILPEKGKLKISIYDIVFSILFISSIAYQYVAITSHGARLV